MSDVHLQDKGGYWYFNCGAVLNDKQERKAKKHCLGRDFLAAKAKAQALKLAWELETKLDPVTGLKVWTPGRIEAAITFALGTATEAPKPEKNAEPVLPATPFVAVASYTLGTALDDFTEMFGLRNDISPQWRTTCKERVHAVRRHLKELESKPLAEFGQEQLDSIRNTILSRPKSTLTELPGCPDLVFARRRKVIFVHGCFWHQHSCARGSRQPKSHAGYWKAKFGRNKARDTMHRSKLRQLDWRVLTIWECETRDTDALSRRIRRFLSG